MAISRVRGYTKPEATEAELSELYMVGESSAGALKVPVSDILPGEFSGSEHGLVKAPSREDSVLGSDGSWVGVKAIDKAFIDDMDWGGRKNMVP